MVRKNQGPYSPRSPNCTTTQTALGRQLLGAKAANARQLWDWGEFCLARRAGGGREWSRSRLGERLVVFQELSSAVFLEKLALGFTENIAEMQKEACLLD